MSKFPLTTTETQMGLTEQSFPLRAQDNKGEATVLERKFQNSRKLKKGQV